MFLPDMDEDFLPDLIPPSPAKMTTPQKNVSPSSTKSRNSRSTALSRGKSNKRATKTDSSDEEIKLDFGAYDRRSSSMEESDLSPAGKYT